MSRREYGVFFQALGVRLVPLKYALFITLHRNRKAMKVSVSRFEHIWKIRKAVALGCKKLNSHF